MVRIGKVEMTVDLPPGMRLYGHPESVSDMVASLRDIREPAKPTKTLILTNLLSSMFEDSNLSSFRHSIELISHVEVWIPLKSFTRVVVSFTCVHEAQQVRAVLDKRDLMGKILHVFYGETESLSGRGSDSLLRVPALEKNWLISPPGSPPVGWTQIREDAPNVQHLHEDLLMALEILVREDTYQQHPSAGDHDRAAGVSATAQAPSESCATAITILQNESPSIPDIVVHLESASSREVAEANGVGGIESTKVSMVKTPMPSR